MLTTTTTSNVRRRRPQAPDLPIELWAHIFSFFSIIEKATKSDADTWADITVIDDAPHRLQCEPANRQITDNIRAKLAIGSVSKLFRTLIRPLIFELVQVRSSASLDSLCRLVEDEAGFAEGLKQHTRRIDVSIEAIGFVSDILESTDKQKLTDIQAIFRACPRLTFLSWSVLDERHFSIDLFRFLPTACPSIEVLYWKSRDPIEISNLNAYTELRVFYLDSDLVPWQKTCAFNLPEIHTLGKSVALVTATLYLSRMPRLRTLLIDELRDHHPRFSFLTIHGQKITSLRNLTLLSSGLPFEQLCPSITDLVIQLEDIEELTRISWLNLKRIGVHLARQSEDLDVRTLVFILESVENSRGRGNFIRVEHIRVMDSALVNRVRKEAVMSSRLVARRLAGWQIRLLDDKGELLLAQA